MVDFFQISSFSTFFTFTKKLTNTLYFALMGGALPLCNSWRAI